MPPYAARPTKVLPNLREKSNVSDGNPIVLTTAEAQLLAADTGGLLIIDRMIVCETSGNARTATFRKYSAASGLLNTAANNLFKALALAASETVIIDGPIYLSNGQILAGLGSANTSISVDISYRKES